MKITTKTFFIYLLFCLPSLALAQQQQDTIFYDDNWNEISNKDSVSFYRIIFKESDQFKVLDYYINGNLQMEGYFSSIEDRIKEGYFKYYIESGLISSEGLFKNNKEEGVWKYYNLGKIWSVQNYKNGELDGLFEAYYSNGKVKRIDNYEKGQFVSGKCFTQNGKDTTYINFRTQPEFKGGEVKLYEYLSKKTVYPKKAQKNNIEGRVVIRFWVDIDGSLVDPEILSKSDPLLNEAALKVIKNMPKWIPGKQEGILVKVSFVLPFDFKLDQ